jgi:hypothetical protein
MSEAAALIGSSPKIYFDLPSCPLRLSNPPPLSPYKCNVAKFGHFKEDEWILGNFLDESMICCLDWMLGNVFALFVCV